MKIMRICFLIILAMMITVSAYAQEPPDIFIKGTLYLYADCYKPKDNWLITEITFHTKANMILPKELLF